MSTSTIASTFLSWRAAILLKPKQETCLTPLSSTASLVSAKPRRCAKLHKYSSSTGEKWAGYAMYPALIFFARSDYFLADRFALAKQVEVIGAAGFGVGA